MTARRLSKLQRQILHKMWTQYGRTQGGISTGHLDLVRALGRDKSNVSHSLRTLDRKSTRLNSSHANISYAVFCLKKKNTHSITAARTRDTHLNIDSTKGRLRPVVRPASPMARRGLKAVLAD